MKIAVQGIGLVSGITDSTDDIKTLYNPNISYTTSFPEQIQGKYKNKFVYKSDTSQLFSYIPKKKLRRVDHFSRMALLGAGKAMEDAGILSNLKDKLGLIVATGYGALKTTFAFLDSYIEKGDKLSFPIHFSNSVHNAAAAHISILYGITGPSLTVSQFEMSFFSALITASAWLKEEIVDAVLVGCSDEFCDVTGYCIHKFSENHGDNNPYSTGEGAAFFLLAAENSSNKPTYGFFDDISIDNYNRSKIDLPKKSLTIVSPGTLGACNLNIIEKLENTTDSEIIIHNRALFPTDISFDAGFLINQHLNRTLCFIKEGEDGEYGKVVFKGTA